MASEGFPPAGDPQEVFGMDRWRWWSLHLGVMAGSAMGIGLLTWWAPIDLWQQASALLLLALFLLSVWSLWRQPNPRTLVVADSWGLCLGNAYDDRKLGMPWTEVRSIVAETRLQTPCLVIRLNGPLASAIRAERGWSDGGPADELVYPSAFQRLPTLIAIAGRLAAMRPVQPAIGPEGERRHPPNRA